MWKAFFAIALAAALVALSGCVEEPVACPDDAKVCPDGTPVGRVAPDCEFGECPVVREEYCGVTNPCEKGDCYIFPGEENPSCFEGDPCTKCDSGQCNVMESYPLQISCANLEKQFCGASTLGACQESIGCVEDGCSGQVCRSVQEEPVFTTCEYVECYNNEEFGMECGCLEGSCQWHAATLGAKAREFCGMENTAGVFVCDSYPYIRVASSLLGGGSVYRAIADNGALGDA